MVLTSGCSASTKETTITKNGKCFGGDVSVTVTFKDGNITKVEATGENETPGIGVQ